MKLKHITLAVPVLLGMGLLNISAGRKLPITTELLDMSNVTFSEKARDNLYNIYKEATVEIPFCLYGSASRHKVHIEDVILPHITKNERTRVHYKKETCGTEGYIGAAHNHPRDIGCTMSVNNVVRVALQDERAKIELITCGTNEKGMNMSVYFIGNSR